MKAQEGFLTVEVLVSAGISQKDAELVADFTMRELRQMDSKQLNDLIEDRRDGFGGLGELFGPSLSQKIQAAIQDHTSIKGHKFYPLNANPYYVYSVIGFPLILTHKKYFCPRCKQFVELLEQNREDEDTIYISPSTYKISVEKGVLRTHYSCNECHEDPFEGLGSLFS